MMIKRRFYSAVIDISVDHLIVGAGVVGLAIAARLAKHVRNQKCENQ